MSETTLPSETPKPEEPAPREKEEIPLDEVRDVVSKMNPQCDFDVSMTFFYDETNNVKKFQWKNANLNVTDEKSFILGGVSYDGNRPDLTDIFSGVQLDKSYVEVKFRHICRKGDLLDCLKSSMLTPLLKKILNKELYIHLSSLNVLYYALADIIDSALNDYPFPQAFDPRFGNLLKDTLYRIAATEREDFMDMLYEYEYPNIPKDKCSEFVSDLLTIVDSFSRDPLFHFGVQNLKHVLKHALKKAELIFLTDEKKHVMIDGLVSLYQRPVYTFINSVHHFDQEADIKKEMERVTLTYHGEPIANFDFSDSKADILTQVSDVVVGLLGQVSNFINKHTMEEIKEQLATLNSVQKENLDLLRQLAEKSYRKNIAFFHYIEGGENKLKWEKVIFY
ncbi:DUF3800 domain-containing protein [Chitinophaga sp. RAB17]|uniref:DUF3800 domain-containing protein n=1 Tax=Chitinophaga sp. RAB17 TaxID=3233049 RepID=UPI003F8F2068